MKRSFFITVVFILTLQPLNAQNIQKKDAADAINFIDTLTNPLKPAAYDLITIHRELKSVANNVTDYKLSNNQIDSLKKYYNILKSAYSHAIKQATLNKKIDKFLGLKSKFLNMLNEGQKPWITVIPIYIEMYTKGKSAISISEQNLLANSGSLFMDSAKKALEYAKILATQEDEIENKYKLELHNDLYR